MKMMCKQLDKKGFSFTGSKVLNLIASKHIPGIDLFVRETIQNSCDAILDKVSFGRIDYTYRQFSSSRLINYFDIIDVNLRKNYPDVLYDFISISDSNTCGLLGMHYNVPGGNNNLYNLVYDVMNGNDNVSAGGSHGIGKTVASMFGCGLCIYYSRTFEEGKYVNKLVATLIENEKNPKSLLGLDKSGIAHFGNYDKLSDELLPIYDEDQITEILSIFNHSLYEDDKTGTILIIPFLDKNKLMNYKINNEEAFWDNNFEEYLKLCVQRWYFPRLNNLAFNGKYIKVFINGEKVQLNKFFEPLQELYNGNIKEGKCFEVKYEKHSLKPIFGNFYYKMFSKEELCIHTPPYNLPSPYQLIDCDNEDNVKNKPILFCVRKHGMVISYSHEEFGEYGEDEKKYLIGMFILNDDVKLNNESLGQYVRATELANHNKWADSNLAEYPYFTSIKPIRYFSKKVKWHLKNEFSNTDNDLIEKSNSKLRKQLGKLLMPPEDFGDRPSTPKQGDPKNNPVPKFRQKPSILFESFEDDNLIFSFEFTLKPNQIFTSFIEIQTNSKIYKLDDWIKYEMPIPFKISKIKFDEITFEKKGTYKSIKIDYEINSLNQLLNNILVKIQNDEICYYKGSMAINNNFKGFEILNNKTFDMRYKVLLYVKPLDFSQSINFSAVINDGKEL